MTSGASPADDERRRLLALFAAELYGPIPPPPDHLEVRRFGHSGYQRLELGLAVEGRRFAVDAALWLPPGPRPAPLIVGLDFLGPIGVLQDAAFPIDRAARIEFRGSTVLDATLRGRGADRWPVDLIQAAGFGLLLSCYGSWVPDDPAAWRDHGLAPLLRSPPETGAIALWAWALSRLVDVALTLPEVDATRIHLAGHSRLGKAALWAAACDERVAGVVANNSGCAGAALSRHTGGETLAQLTARYPHWLTPSTCQQSRSGSAAGRPAPAPRLHRPAPALCGLGVGGSLGRPPGRVPCPRRCRSGLGPYLAGAGDGLAARRRATHLGARVAPAQWRPRPYPLGLAPLPPAFRWPLRLDLRRSAPFDRFSRVSGRRSVAQWDESATVRCTLRT